MLALILLTACAVDPPDPGPVPHSLAARVERALAEQPELLAHHRGYLSYADAHPEFAALEANWRQAALLSEMAPLVREFDEALAANPETERVFDQFYDTLARDESLRVAVEQLQRMEFEDTDWTRRFAPSLDYLRAHPDVARRLLERPQGDMALPEALRSFPPELRTRPGLLDTLRGAYGVFERNPAFLTRALPWWQARYGVSDDVAGAGAALGAAFLERPHRFWIWHRRNLALAEDVQARDWIRYWFRRVRRETGLAGEYPLYLHYLRQRPEQKKNAEMKWRRELESPPEWPPAEAPPPLQGRARAEKGKAPKKPDYALPARPQVPRPKMPARPARPEGPSMPTAPVKPQTPAPEMRQPASR